MKDLEKNKTIINKLNDYRDQYLAHDDRNKNKIIITKEEVDILFKLLEEDLSLFSSRVDFSHTSYYYVENVQKDTIKKIISYLQRF